MKFKMKVTIGKTFKEIVVLDFDKTPHMVGGGTTRYGKTNLTKVIMTDLIRKYGEDVEFYLFDLKKGVEFGRYEHLEQVKGLATDVDEAVELCTKMVEDLDKRMIYFKTMKWNNIVDSPMKKRTFVIVDEAGELVPESFMSKSQKDKHHKCQAALSHMARIGGGFGFRELFFSQYTTSDVLPRQIKQNANAKICFRIASGYASEVILDKGNTDAAHLKNIPGRAVFIDGPNKCELQVPLITDKQMEDVLGEWYRTERKDVTDQGHDTSGESASEVIEIGNTAS